MDEPELPTSPRKKLKHEEPSLVVTMADTVTEASAVPESAADVPHSLTDTTIDQLHKQTIVDSADASTSSKGFEPPSAMPNSKMEDSHYHSEAQGELLSEKITSASEAQSARLDVSEAQDELHSKEVACGITEFVSPDLLGFQGILKKRYAFCDRYYWQQI